MIRPTAHLHRPDLVQDWSDQARRSLDRDYRELVGERTG
jgi:hypothetical protein